MRGLNTIVRNTVPIFLALLALSLGACDHREESGEATPLTKQEVFVVEQYLRLVELRHAALAGDSLLEADFEALAEVFPADSLRSVTARISADSPDRWIPIFEEIIRRKEIMADESR
jgi:hypothetical protein